jgi:hypothetical protein
MAGVIIGVGAGLILGALHIMYNHDRHISDYAVVSIDDIKDDRNHIVEIRNTRIHGLIFQDLSTRSVNYLETNYTYSWKSVPVTKTRISWIPGRFGPTSYSETYTTYEMKYAPGAELVEKTRTETNTRTENFLIGCDDRIALDNDVGMNSLTPMKITGVSEAKTYIGEKIPDFKGEVKFNNCFYHHEFGGKAYLYGKMWVESLYVSTYRMIRSPLFGDIHGAFCV